MGKRFENVRAEVNAKLEAAKKEGVTYAGALLYKAKAEEAWSFAWMVAGVDEKTNEELKEEWGKYNREFEKILATK